MGQSQHVNIFSLFRNHQQELQLCNISVCLSGGINDFRIIGGADSTVKEARLRVKFAIRAADFRFPSGKIIVNLSPVAQLKQGSTFDLPIALAILAASKQIELPSVCLSYGELSLSGQVNDTGDLLSYRQYEADKQQIKIILDYIYKLADFPKIKCYLPADMKEEYWQNIKNCDYFSISQLKDLHNLSAVIANNGNKANFARSSINLPDYQQEEIDSRQRSMLLSLERQAQIALDNYVELQNMDFSKRSLHIALAGGHPLLFIGSNGSGKTELLHSAVYFLENELKQVWQTYNRELRDLEQILLDVGCLSLPGQLWNGQRQSGKLLKFKSGLLFLSELNKFRSKSLLCLEEFWQRNLTYTGDNNFIDTSSVPSDVHSQPFCQLLCDMNPCPCGNLFEPWLAACHCSEYRVKQFNQHIGGALWDRLSMICLVRREELPVLNILPPNSLAEAVDDKTALNKSKHDKILLAEKMRDNIQKCRNFQRERNYSLCHRYCLNAQLNLAELSKIQVLTTEMQDFINTMHYARHLSFRRLLYLRALALTLADFQGRECNIQNFIEAAAYIEIPEEIQRECA